MGEQDKDVFNKKLSIQQSSETSTVSLSKTLSPLNQKMLKPLSEETKPSGILSPKKSLPPLTKKSTPVGTETSLNSLSLKKSLPPPSSKITPVSVDTSLKPLSPKKLLLPSSKITLVSVDTSLKPLSPKKMLQPPSTKIMQLSVETPLIPLSRKKTLTPLIKEKASQKKIQSAELDTEKTTHDFKNLSETAEQETIIFTPEMIDENTIVQSVIYLDQKSFINLLKLLDDYYYNDDELISDDTYDEIIDIYETKYGPYKNIGADPRGEKITLPYYMGSLRKFRQDKDLHKWLDLYTGPYIVQDKVDGISLLLISSLDDNGKRKNFLYTRGRGHTGKDVSHMLRYMNLPTLNVNIAIRGEAVLTKKVFESIGGSFKNARNAVSGIIMRKKTFDPDIAKKISFYAYRIMSENNPTEVDVEKLQKMGFLVPNPVLTDALTSELLENYYNQRKEDAPYQIDGLVVYQNKAVEYPNAKYPLHVIAYKTHTPSVVTTVLNVIWNASKDKKLKPVINYEPVIFSGIELRNATGHNARYIISNNIGPGAKIMVTHWREVNPRVIAVITPSESGPSYPDPNIHGEYKWNDNNVEFILIDDNDIVKTSKLVYFIKTLDIKGIGNERVSLFVKHGIKDIDSLLLVTPEQLNKIPGIGNKLSTQFYEELHEKIKNISLSKIMTASGFFPGIGETRFSQITDVYPNLLDYSDHDTETIINMIKKIKGFDSLAEFIALHLKEFNLWLQKNPSISIQKEHKKFTSSDKLSGVTFVFSGFRDSELKNKIQELGGRVTTSVSKNTSYVVLDNLEPQSFKGKALDAQSLGIPIISKDDLINNFI